MSDCPRCSYEFNVVQRQIVINKDFTVQSTQLYCPKCWANLDNWPQKIIRPLESTTKRDEG